MTHPGRVPRRMWPAPKTSNVTKKNERRRRNLHVLADRQQVPSLGVHVNFYLLQALPFGPTNARGKVAVPDLLANARLFFTSINCLDGVVDQVYNRTGGFQERFRTVFSNTIQHQQHLKYHKKTRESLAHVTGEFVIRHGCAIKGLQRQYFST